MTNLRSFIVSTVVVYGAALAPAVSADGEAVYNSGCMACHMTGVAGAPKVGDVEAWLSGRVESQSEIPLSAWLVPNTVP